MEMSKNAMIISWVLRIIISAIFIMVVFFKFTGAEDSKRLFTHLMGAEYEAIGRIGSGLTELFSVILLLLPKTVVFGAIVAFGTMTGAIFGHFTKLGIVVGDDGGSLFGMAVVVFFSSLGLLYIYRKDIPIIREFL